MQSSGHLNSNTSNLTAKSFISISAGCAIDGKAIKPISPGACVYSCAIQDCRVEPLIRPTLNFQPLTLSGYLNTLVGVPSTISSKYRMMKNCAHLVSKELCPLSEHTYNN